MQLPLAVNQNSLSAGHEAHSTLLRGIAAVANLAVQTWLSYPNSTILSPDSPQNPQVYLLPTRTLPPFVEENHKSCLPLLCITICCWPIAMNCYLPDMRRIWGRISLAHSCCGRVVLLRPARNMCNISSHVNSFRLTTFVHARISLAPMGNASRDSYVVRMHASGTSGGACRKRMLVETSMTLL